MSKGFGRGGIPLPAHDRQGTSSAYYQVLQTTEAKGMGKQSGGRQRLCFRLAVVCSDLRAEENIAYAVIRPNGLSTCDGGGGAGAYQIRQMAHETTCSRGGGAAGVAVRETCGTCLVRASLPVSSDTRGSVGRVCQMPRVRAGQDKTQRQSQCLNICTTRHEPRGPEL